MNATEFLRMLQQFETFEAIGSTALRNQGTGLLGALRSLLGELDLATVPRTRKGFQDWLDDLTRQALDALPRNITGRPWGAVRKGINLFLRGCVLNHYLRSAYGLETIESWLEVPLDSIVAGALKREAGRGALPVWLGLKHLTPEANAEFQTFAEQYARQRGFKSRAHLDIELWLTNR